MEVLLDSKGHERMTTILNHGKHDPRTDWDYLNGVVDGIILHAISSLRPGGLHEGSIVTGNGRGNPAVRYPISLSHSVADCDEAELIDLVRGLRSTG
jgi:hypothetical protein